MLPLAGKCFSWVFASFSGCKLLDRWFDHRENGDNWPTLDRCCSDRCTSQNWKKNSWYKKFRLQTVWHVGLSQFYFHVFLFWVTIGACLSIFNKICLRNINLMCKCLSTQTMTSGFLHKVKMILISYLPESSGPAGLNVLHDDAIDDVAESRKVTQ